MTAQPLPSNPGNAERIACYRSCPIDWVACFKQDCPRAAEIKRQQRERINRFLGRRS